MMKKKKKVKAKSSLKVQDLSFFGMMKNEKKSVEEIMAELRAPRYKRSFDKTDNEII